MTPDSSVHHPEESSEDENSPIEEKENSPIDMEEDEVIEMPKKTLPGRRGRKRNVPQSEIDLTVDPVLASPSKSRRRIADEIKAVLVEAEIDLSGDAATLDVSTPEDEQSLSQRGRGRRAKAKAKPKAVKPRRVSFRKALATTKSQIPQLNTQIQTPDNPEEVEVSNESPQEISNVPSTSGPVQSNSIDYGAIDLTGEVDLQNYHSALPLFAQPTEPLKTRSSQELKKKFSIGLGDLDFDVDEVTIHIKVNGKLEKYKQQGGKQFFEVLKKISEKHKIQVSNVLLFDEKDKTVSPEDTPDKIGHKLSSIYSELND